ncbi:hypothetical protein ACFLW1_02910 [Chloroflexota bacterium]
MRILLSGTVKILALIVAVLIVGVSAWPLWTGDAIYTGGRITPGYRIIIPDYYSEAADWLEGQEGNFRILSMPLHKIFNVAYSWENGFIGTDPTFRLLPKNVIMSGLDGKNFGTTMSEWITVDATADFAKLLKLMNAKYILFHRDANLDYMREVPWYIPTTLEILEATLGRQDGLTLEKSFGELDFYRNEYWQPAHLYATGDMTYVNGNRQALIPLAVMNGLDSSSAVFLNGYDTENSQLTLDKSNIMLIIPPDELPEYELEVNAVPGATEEINFETGEFGIWRGTHTPSYSTGSIDITNTDSHSGVFSAEVSLSGTGGTDNFSAEQSLNGQASQAHLHRDFNYNGTSPLNINAWLKIVSRTAPAGAFIYLHGYDANGLEKVRILYHAYENWDTPTGTPGQYQIYGYYPYYSLKVNLWEPPLDTWINIDRNPKEEFDAQFPGVWETLNLTRTRLDFNSWCDGEITTRYDDIKLSGISKIITKAHLTYNLFAPQDGRYGLYALVRRYYNQDFTYSIDGGPAKSPTGIIESDDYFHTVKLMESWLDQGNNAITLTFEGEREGTDFETGGFGTWLTKYTQRGGTGPLEVTSSDSHTGTYSAELAISGKANQAHMYREFDYDGSSYVNFNAWLKIASRKAPAGAFINLHGYDVEGIERVRVIYHAYDNWDTPTGIPGKYPEYADYPYYSLKVPLGEVPLNTWINVEQNPRNEFEARFPRIWESLNLVKIRLDLNGWCDGEITARFDDIKITSQYDNVEVGSVFGNPVSYLYLYSEDKNGYTPDITYQRINPTEYRVHIDAKQPFTLVFSESHHSQWKAYYGKTNWLEAWFRQPINEENHFQVNGYANAWYIDEVGEYDITLYYKTQSMFYIGTILSGLGLIAGISYAGWRWMRRGNHVD